MNGADDKGVGVRTIKITSDEFVRLSQDGDIGHWTMPRDDFFRAFFSSLAVRDPRFEMMGMPKGVRFVGTYGDNIAVVVEDPCARRRIAWAIGGYGEYRNWEVIFRLFLSFPRTVYIFTFNRCDEGFVRGGFHVFTSRRALESADTQLWELPEFLVENYQGIPCMTFPRMKSHAIPDIVAAVINNFWTTSFLPTSSRRIYWDLYALLPAWWLLSKIMPISIASKIIHLRSRRAKPCTVTEVVTQLLNVEATKEKKPFSEMIDVLQRRGVRSCD